MTWSTRPAPREARLVASGSAWAAAVLGEIAPGCRIVGVTKGRFSLIDLLAVVLDQTGPADVTVSTWATSIEDAESLSGLERVRTMTLLVDRSLPSRGPDYHERLTRAFGDRVLFTRVHAKFALVRNGRWNIAIRTSMNLNRNIRLEQFDLDDDAAICDFLQAVVTEVAALGVLRDKRDVDDAFERVLAGPGQDDDEAIASALED